jgi:hypothetical protein
MQSVQDRVVKAYVRILFMGLKKLCLAKPQIANIVSNHVTIFLRSVYLITGPSSTDLSDLSVVAFTTPEPHSETHMLGTPYVDDISKL